MNTYCQYTKGKCDQERLCVAKSTGFFVYSSQPTSIAGTIGKAIKELRDHTSEQQWVDWKKLPIQGKLIFCEICKAIDLSDMVIADITTLNFNVLFELGYAIGRGKPVIPIRDTTYERDKPIFDQLGIFDTIGYTNFQNSRDLVSIATKPKPSPVIAIKMFELNKEQPIYYVKSPIDTDMSIKISSSLKKGAFDFRIFDPKETMRLSLHEAYKQVMTSVSVIAHLVEPARTGADIHNGLAAFVCGMAMAAGKQVLMLQESIIGQPIDYRDVVVSISDIGLVSHHVEQFVRTTWENLLRLRGSNVIESKLLLEKIDVGDVAAENEIHALERYFVKTPEYQQAVQGHARLIVGRKGSGKTAIFYGITREKGYEKNTLILDLKPEGHQFVKLKEQVLTNLSSGFQLHILTAFWNYILLLELARKILYSESKDFYRDPQSIERYNKFLNAYKAHVGGNEGDFSERLMAIVDKVIHDFPSFREHQKPEVTELLYSGDIKEMSEEVACYLSDYDEVWLLFDNIDKGWPSQGANNQDIAILRCLLEAMRKLQRSLEKHTIDFKCLVFVRKDIYDLLIDQMSDRGKESVVNLDWSNEFLLKELLRKRFNDVKELSGKFEDIWTRIFDAHVGGENSFRYIISRTLLRPRDILNFVRKCIHIAISREHIRVLESDILLAEKAYSEDMLRDLSYEIRDVFPDNPDIVNHFIKQPFLLSRDDITVILLDCKVPEEKVDTVIDHLLWFSFLGIKCGDENRFSYQVNYNLTKLKSYILSDQKSAMVYCIHPAFRAALESTEN